MAIVYNNQPVNEFLTKESIYGGGSFGGFAFSVDGKVPYIAMAIHAGSHVRGELLRLMQIGAAERYLEENPETDTMIRGAA